MSLVKWAYRCDSAAANRGVRLVAWRSAGWASRFRRDVGAGFLLSAGRASWPIPRRRHRDARDRSRNPGSPTSWRNLGFRALSPTRGRAAVAASPALGRHVGRGRRSRASRDVGHDSPDAQCRDRRPRRLALASRAPDIVVDRACVSHAADESRRSDGDARPMAAATQPPSRSRRAPAQRARPVHQGFLVRESECAALAGAEPDAAGDQHPDQRRRRPARRQPTTRSR